MSTNPSFIAANGFKMLPWLEYFPLLTTNIPVDILPPSLTFFPSISISNWSSLYPQVMPLMKLAIEKLVLPQHPSKDFAL
jgi:hypothetical protein